MPDFRLPTGQDQTLDHDFEFRVYPTRFGEAEATYHLTRKPYGWYFRFSESQGSCDKRGVPLLFDNLRHDGIEYPRSLAERMERLWLEAKEKNLSHAEVQEALDRLSQWLRKVDAQAPAYDVRGEN